MFVLSNFGRVACGRTERSPLPLSSVEGESTQQPREQSQEFPGVLSGPDNLVMKLLVFKLQFV